MREIKVFLASSEELDNERKEIADLVLNLNDIYSEKGISIRLFKWEYLGKTYNGVRKQEEYNQAVRGCDIFLGLFYTKAGEFTLEEFNVAVEQYNKSRQTPLILVFLKDLTSSDIEDESLKSFKARLATDLEHYWARFNHTDKLKLDIVLQLQRFDIFGQSGQIYVKDSNIFLADGTLVASLENLSFASNNQQWNHLKTDVAKLERKIRRYATITDLDEDELADFAEMKKDLDEKQKELQSLELAMFNTALVIAQSVGTKSSERLRKAHNYFEKGDLEAANAVLDYQQVMIDTDKNKQLYEQEQKILEVRRENLLLNIQELRMKISLLISKKEDDTTEDDLRNAVGALGKISEICETIKMPDPEQWNIAIEILNQFYSSNKFSLDFIISIAWDFIHELKKESKKMGYDLAYRFIIKCLLIIAKSYQEKTHDYSCSLLRLLKLALDYNKKVYEEENIERANIYALIGDCYYHRYRLTYFRYDDEIMYYCSKAKELRENLLGRSHPDTINVCSNIAYYLHRMFYDEQAVEIMSGLMNDISVADNEYRPEEGIYIVDSHFNRETVYFVFNTALYYGNYAYLLREMNRFEEAICYYEKALDVAKSNYNLLCEYMAWMGRCYVELEKYDKGIECVIQSLKMASAFWGVDYSTDIDEDFCWYWTASADTDGMSFSLVRLIAIAYYKMGNVEEALKYATEYLDLALHAERIVNSGNNSYGLSVPDIAEAYKEKGFLYLKLNQNDKSIEALENALRILKGRKDYMNEAPAVLDILVDACRLSKRLDEANLYSKELERISDALEEDSLLYEPSVSTIAFSETKELPNVTLKAGEYTLLKYGDYEVGKDFPFDKTMQDDELKDLVILQDHRIHKYNTSLKYCGFTLRTSGIDADSVNELMAGLSKFMANEDNNDAIYNPFVYSIKIDEPINTACGNVIPSGVYPLYKYGAFEVGKFQKFNNYISDYDLPQLTIIQIGNELHDFWLRLKGYTIVLSIISQSSHIVEQHVERLKKYLGDKYVEDELSVFLTIAPTIQFEEQVQLGEIILSCNESYNLIQMGDYEIGNLNEPELSDTKPIVVLTEDHGFLQIDPLSIKGKIGYTITTYQVEKDVVNRIKEEYEEWKRLNDMA